MTSRHNITAATTDSHSNSAPKGFADLARRVRGRSIQRLQLRQLRSTRPHTLLVACRHWRRLACIEERRERRRDAGDTPRGHCGGGDVLVVWGAGRLVLIGVERERRGGAVVRRGGGLEGEGEGVGGGGHVRGGRKKRWISVLMVSYKGPALTKFWFVIGINVYLGTTPLYIRRSF